MNNDEPTAEELAEFPEVDFSDGLPNRFAGRRIGSQPVRLVGEPPSGTPIEHLAEATPAEIERLRAAGIVTVDYLGADHDEYALRAFALSTGLSLARTRELHDCARRVTAS